jgi:thiosulfate reductase cytochrome b subunit
MGASGLQILRAFPSLGARGALYSWYPFQGKAPPSWLRLGGWLGGARALHFSLAWLLLGNAVVYLVYYFSTGEWRRRMFSPRRDLREAIAMAMYYLRLRKEAPPQGLYNALQRLAYTSAIALGAVEVLSGLAIYKPVQLRWLASLLGGYDAARAIHLGGLCALAGFVITHLVMVALHPRALGEMVTGGKPHE